MKKFFTISLAGFFTVMAATLLITGCHQKMDHSAKKMKKKGDNKYDGMDKAIELEIEQTKNPFTGKVPWQQWRIAMEQTEAAKEASRTEAIQALSWIERGPNGDFSRQNGNSRPNDDQTSGRIRATMIDSLDPTHKTVFVGSVAGGLWKTTDITASPANWVLVNDFLSNLAIADICQDPRPGFQNIMYMCTGESYSNADAIRGVGVFKSVDAGATWNFLPSTSTFLSGTRILCDFQGNVYLGTRNTGLQRSTDGGSTWTDITPTGIGTSVCDLEISSTAVAGRLHVTTGIFSTSGYRYTDNPSTVTAGGWTSAATPFTTFNQRTELGISGDNLFACPDNSSHQVPTIWRSTDGGVNWAAVPVQPGGGTWANGQGWYDLSCGVNPANPNECIVGGLECYKTTNGGTSWVKIAVWVGSSGQYIHADQHDVQWWDGGSKVMFACDGGIHYSGDGGTTIRDRNKGLRIKQFYSVAIHPTETNLFIAGAQDNGMHRLNHPGLDSSIEFYGGDGMLCAIDQNEPQFQFGSAFNNNIRRSLNGGASWGNVAFSGGRFVSPWDYDNINNKIYLCSGSGNFIRWDNPQTGTTSATISVTDFGGLQVSAVHVSPYTANRVFFGTSNGSTSRLVRLDDAHTAAPTSTIITPTGAAGYLNCVVTGSSDQNLIACYTNFGVNNVWVSSDGGTTWAASDGNLPDMPVRWALFHPDSDTKAYIATATGVWETDLLNGASTVWNANPTFPNVSTDMIKYRASDRTIAAGTHGRGIWSATIPAAGGFSFNNPAPAVATCPAPATMDIVLGTIPAGGFTNPITVSASTPPAGTAVSFIPGATVTPGNSVTVRLTGTNTLAAGSYVLTITGTASGASNQLRDITYTINPGSGPAITAQPAGQVICAGANTSFSITAATATSFQWQLSTDGGATYNNVPAAAPYSGTASATLTITGATAGLNGNRYRCNASTLCGTTASNGALLTVNTAPSVTSHPVDATVCTGSGNTFSVTATGNGLTYQWQISNNGCAGPWTNIGGAISPSYTLTGITAGQNNTGYRCVVTGGSCTPAATSNCALLTVVTSVTITGQPSDQSVCEGSNTSFTVAASGTGIIYQWQVSTDGGGTYTNINNGGFYSGATAATLSITGAAFSLNNNRYRCQLSNPGCTTPGISNAAILTVNTLPAIVTQPVNAAICAGSNNSFSVTATGSGITYQWQLSVNGCAGPWTNVANAGVYSGVTTPTLTITGAVTAMNGIGYRCVVSGLCAPAATSACAILTVVSPVTITAQPANVEVCSGSNAVFSVTGTSSETIIYKWQVSTDAGATWSDLTGANASSYTVVNTTVLMSNNRYRCLLSNATCPSAVATAGAILTVRQLPAIGLTAAPLTSLLPGQSTTLTATPSASTGGTLTTSWYKDGTAFSNTGNTYVVDMTKLGSYQVKIQEAFVSGLSCFNESPILTITAAASTRLFIFPSPNDGRFTVSYYNNGGAAAARKLTVYDSKGARVFNAKFSIIGPYTLMDVDLRPAQRGIYYVVVGDAGGKKLAEGKVIVHW